MNDKGNFLTSTPVVDRSLNERPVNRESPINARPTRASRRIDFSSYTLPSSQISVIGTTIDKTNINEETEYGTKCPVCCKSFLYTSKFKDHLIRSKNCKIGYHKLKDSAKHKSPEVQHICQDCGKTFSLERNFRHHTRYRCDPIPQYDGGSSVASHIVNNDVHETAVADDSPTINHTVFAAETQTISQSLESTGTVIATESQTISQSLESTGTVIAAESQKICQSLESTGIVIAAESQTISQSVSNTSGLTRLTENVNLLVSSQRPFFDNDDPDSSSSSSSDSEEDIQQVCILINGLCIII